MTVMGRSWSVARRDVRWHRSHRAGSAGSPLLNAAYADAKNLLQRPEEPVLDAETTAFLESGCALIVGTRRPGRRAPRRPRLGAHGARLSRGQRPAAASTPTTSPRSHVAGGGGPIAITAASVRTLRRSSSRAGPLSVEAGTPTTTLARADALLRGDVHRHPRDRRHSTGAARRSCARAGYVACTVAVDAGLRPDARARRRGAVDAGGTA